MGTLNFHSTVLQINTALKIKFIKKKKKRVSRSALREFSEGIGEVGGYSREKGS